MKIVLSIYKLCLVGDKDGCIKSCLCLVKHWLEENHG